MQELIAIKYFTVLSLQTVTPIYLIHWHCEFSKISYPQLNLPGYPFNPIYGRKRHVRHDQMIQDNWVKEQRLCSTLSETMLPGWTSICYWIRIEWKIYNTDWSALVPRLYIELITGAFRSLNPSLIQHPSENQAVSWGMWPVEDHI